jgi:outer membrane lipoprotein-sorting protein
MKRKLLLVVALTLSATFTQGWAQDAQPDYLYLLDKAMYMERAELRMEMYENGKMVNHYEMAFFRSGNKIRMEFTAPAAEKERRMLSDNASLWMYLPHTSKVMKLPFGQSFMGSDASNSDLMRMNFRSDYELVEVRKMGEENLVALRLKAKDLEVAYPEVSLVYDTQRNVPIQQEIYSLSGELVKAIRYGDIVRQGEEYIPSTMMIKEGKNTLTRLIYSGILKESEQPAGFFTPTSL